jgi:hypothetical protein
MAISTFVYTSRSGVIYNFTPTNVTITLAGKIVASGSWAASNTAELFDLPKEALLGTPLNTVMTKVKANSVKIAHTYVNFVVTNTWTMNGEDISIVSNVENKDAALPLRMLRFGGLQFHFDKQASGFLRSWHWDISSSCQVGSDAS